MTEPKRLLEATNTSALERALLESAPTSVEPSDAQCAAVWGSIAARIAAIAPVAVAASGSTAAGQAPLSAVVKLAGKAKWPWLSVPLKVAAVALPGAMLAAGGAGWVLSRDAAPRTAVAHGAAPADSRSLLEPGVAREVPLPADPSAVTAAPIRDPSDMTAAATASSRPERTAESTHARPKREAQPARTARLPSRDSLRDESALLLAAREAMAKGNAPAALAQLDEAAARFPAGVLEEEREALAIRALEAAGRRPEAQARAAAFLRAYPNSPYARRLRSLASAPSADRP